jgi:hypothetical protein
MMSHESSTIRYNLNRGGKAFWELGRHSTSLETSGGRTIYFLRDVIPRQFP